VCQECGTYRGRQAVDIETQKARGERRRIKKEKALGEYEGKTAEAKKAKQEAKEQEAQEGPLDPAALSKK